MARGILADRRLVVLDVQTTALTDPWAVQVSLTDPEGNVLLDEHLNPLAGIRQHARDPAPGCVRLPGKLRAHSPSTDARVRYSGDRYDACS